MAISGARCNAVAIFVRGPSAAIVISSWANTVLTKVSTPSVGTIRPSIPYRSFSMPKRKICFCVIGSCNPEHTETSYPRSLLRFFATRARYSTGPCTVVISLTSNPERSAYARAIASSTSLPMSVSIMRGMRSPPHGIDHTIRETQHACAFHLFPETLARIPVCGLRYRLLRHTVSSNQLSAVQDAP